MKVSDETKSIFDELSSITDPEKARKFITGVLSSSKMSFGAYFNEYLSAHPDLSLPQIIKDSGVSRTYCYEILNDKKKGNRDKIIAISYAAKMTASEANHALSFSGNSPLYPKDQRDATIIMAFNFMNRGYKEYQTVTDLNLYLSDNNFTPLSTSKE